MATTKNGNGNDVAGTGGSLSLSAQAVLRHITKVKLETQENIFALQAEMKALTRENQQKAQELADMDSKLQAHKAQIVLLEKEGTEKYQLEERDDWRALVESLTADRKRLNKEITAAAKEKNEQQIQHSIVQTELRELREHTLADLQARLDKLDVDTAGSEPNPTDGKDELSAQTRSDAEETGTGQAVGVEDARDTNENESPHASAANGAQNQTGDQKKPAAASKENVAPNAAIQEIRAELLRQLERVRARRAKRRAEADGVAKTRQDEIDRLRRENQKLLSQLSRVKGQDKKPPDDIVGEAHTGNPDAGGSSCFIQ